MDIPQNEVCAIVNIPLWEIFVEAYKEKYRYGPSARMWTEELVVQWFDRQYKVKDEDYA